MTPRRAVAFLAVLAAAFAAAPGFEAASPDDGLETRLFTIRFRPVEDVVLLIESHIGERGSYTVQPRLKALTVRDARENLDRIGELIAGYDQPPRSVRLVIQLIRATEADPASLPRRGPDTGVPDLLRDVTKWSEVSVIGSASIVGVEGAQSTLNVGGDFRVRFRVDAVAEKQGIIKFDRLVLERLVADAAGGTRPMQILDTVLNLRNGRQLLLGATSSQESRRAIFLSLTATIDTGDARRIPEE